ncbi:hypothetical protein AZA_72986 [Nitrospirillum viridazoti Y2]|nr:hypothetical protein AZA_72986 [Nitrospirillum amazonense Y2]
MAAGARTADRGGGPTVRDGAIGETHHAADAVGGGADRARHAGEADGAGVAAHDAAHLAGPADRAGNGDVADGGAAGRAHQGAHVVAAGDGDVGERQVGQLGRGGGGGEQARIGGGTGNGQAADGMALARHFAGEGGDGHEAAAPYVGGVREGGGQADVIGDGVAGAGVQGHQLQFMGVADGGAGLRAQHRAGQAGGQVPGVAEIPAAEVGLDRHLRGGAAGGAGGRAATNAAGLAGGLRIPIGIAEGGTVVQAHQPANRGARCADGAAGVAVADGAGGAQARQAADIIVNPAAGFPDGGGGIAVGNVGGNSRQAAHQGLAADRTAAGDGDGATGVGRGDGCGAQIGGDAQNAAGISLPASDEAEIDVGQRGGTGDGPAVVL